MRLIPRFPRFQLSGIVNLVAGVICLGLFITCIKDYMELRQLQYEASVMEMKQRAAQEQAAQAGQGAQAGQPAGGKPPAVDQKQEHKDIKIPDVKKPDDKKPEKKKDAGIIMKKMDFARKDKIMRILRWKQYGNVIDKKIVQYSPDKLKKMGCKVSDCEIIKGQNELDNSDIIWFDMDQCRGMKDPLYRQNYHKFLFMAREPPTVIRPLEGWKDMFNLTMSFRLDSDVVDVYGKTFKRAKKTKVEDIYPDRATLWLVSNCFPQSNREMYVRELRKYTQISVHGRCGHEMPPNCNQKKNHFDSCTSKFRSEFKFSLSFESSLCKDYVTEKFWEILMLYSVPIVMGMADYKSIAPPQSYIDVRNFTKPVNLAKYINRMHKPEYQSFLKWKETYDVVRGNATDAAVLCQMCKVAHELKNTQKIYQDMPQWWLGDNCKSIDEYLAKSS